MKKSTFTKGLVGNTQGEHSINQMTKRIISNEFLSFRLLLSISALIMFSIVAQAQNSGELRGKVTDENGDGLPSVNIILKGSESGEKAIGVVTDFDGEFSLRNVNTGDVLQITYVGMLPIDYTVTDADLQVFNSGKPVKMELATIVTGSAAVGESYSEKRGFARVMQAVGLRK